MVSNTTLVESYIVEDHAYKQVERDAEDVDDCGATFLGHVLAAHLHHAGPEDADGRLKYAEGNELHLTRKTNGCEAQPHGHICISRRITDFPVHFRNFRIGVASDLFLIASML